MKDILTWAAGLDTVPKAIASIVVVLVAAFILFVLWGKQEGRRLEPPRAGVPPDPVVPKPYAPSPSPPPRDAPPDERSGTGFPRELARGWTLHKKGEAFTFYLVLDTADVPEFVAQHMRIPDVPLSDVASHLMEAAPTLHADVTRHFARPDPPRTPVGRVAADLVEHIHHTPPQSGRTELMTWNYEYIREGTAIKALQPQPVDLSALSSESRRVVRAFDELARDLANRRYLDAIQRASGSGKGS